MTTTSSSRGGVCFPRDLAVTSYHDEQCIALAESIYHYGLRRFQRDPVLLLRYSTFLQVTRPL